MAFNYGFMDETQGDVLNNFPNDSIQANISRGLLAITMFFTYPMESFVARHVLVYLFHNGHMENTTSSDDRSCIDRILLDRRERMTIIIYITTLVPALFFEDLGPVLSISGAVGASCLAYIAPGMAYLAVNGNAFLNCAYSLIGQQCESKEETTASSIDLPVAGDANRVIIASNNGSSTRQQPTETLELPVSGTPTELITNPPPTPFKCKPIWWYTLGMPIWCGIASIGSSRISRHSAANTTANAITQNDNDSTAESSSAEITTNGSSHYDTQQQQSRHDEELLSPPTRFDFLIAIFFIMFGIIALACGLTTNILTQMNKFGSVG